MDVQPIDGSDPVYNAKAILQELEKFSPTLAKLPIVLVLNKLDQLPEDSREEWCKHILEELQWDGPVFKTSGLMSEGTQQVVYYLMDQIEQQREREVEDPEYAAEMKAFRDQLEAKHVNKPLPRKKRIVRCAVSNVLQVCWAMTTKTMMVKMAKVEVYYVR